MFLDTPTPHPYVSRAFALQTAVFQGLFNG